MNFIKILSILTVRTSPQIESNIKITDQNIIRRRKWPSKIKGTGHGWTNFHPTRLKRIAIVGFLKLVSRTLWVWYENHQQAKSLFVVLCNPLPDFFLFTVSAYRSRKMVVRGQCCIPRKSWSNWSDAIMQKTGNFLVLYRCLTSFFWWYATVC